MANEAVALMERERLYDRWRALANSYFEETGQMPDTDELLGLIVDDLDSCKHRVVPGSAAVSDVAAERQRQVEKEGWTAAHDDAEHCAGELANAAACYAVGFPIYGIRQPGVMTVEPLEKRLVSVWPWATKWWKHSNRRRDLVKAGALILAEIERLDRASPEAAAGEVQARRRTYVMTHVNAAGESEPKR